MEISITSLLLSLLLIMGHTSLFAKECALPLWSPDYQQQVEKEALEYINQLPFYPSFIYPNQGIDRLFLIEASIPVFVYGSLLNEKSATRTLSAETVQKMRPVLSFGLKRLFNYYMENPIHWGKMRSDKEKAMLNVRATGNPHDITNGGLIWVEQSELTHLIQREQGYDLIPVVVVDWTQLLHEEKNPRFRIAYTFSASDSPRNGKIYTNSNIEPVVGYTVASDEGASRFGTCFQQFWEETTYLADGKTMLSMWKYFRLLKKMK